MSPTDAFSDCGLPGAAALEKNGIVRRDFRPVHLVCVAAGRRNAHRRPVRHWRIGTFGVRVETLLHVVPDVALEQFDACFFLYRLGKLLSFNHVSAKFVHNLFCAKYIPRKLDGMSARLLGIKRGVAVALLDEAVEFLERHSRLAKARKIFVKKFRRLAVGINHPCALHIVVDVTVESAVEYSGTNVQLLEYPVFLFCHICEETRKAVIAPVPCKLQRKRVVEPHSERLRRIGVAPFCHTVDLRLEPRAPSPTIRGNAEIDDNVVFKRDPLRQPFVAHVGQGRNAFSRILRLYLPRNFVHECEPVGRMLRLVAFPFRLVEL